MRPLRADKPGQFAAKPLVIGSLWLYKICTTSIVIDAPQSRDYELIYFGRWDKGQGHFPSPVLNVVEHKKIFVN